MHIDALADEIQRSRPHYIDHPIEKTGGGLRDISIPDELTMRIQRLILRDLDSSVTFLPCVTAFCAGTSILDNARAHLGSDYLLHYDLANFFDNITTDRVKAELNRRNFTAHFIRIVIKWCMHKNRLPQGAPTSPLLSNLVCYSLDRRLSKLATKLRATYTRYADDIIVSGDENILRHQNVIKRIIRTEQFIINSRKTEVAALDTPAVVFDGNNFNRLREYHIITGLTVSNDRVSIRPTYLRTVWKAARRDPNSPRTKGKIAFVQRIDEEEGEKLRNEINGNNTGEE